MKLDFLRDRTPVVNRTPAGMHTPVLGLVLHQQMGEEPGTDAWFHNASAQASSHFGAPERPYSATLLGDQWVDTDDEAWAEVAGNRYWWSVENAGYGGALTPNQLEIAARIMAALHLHKSVPLQISDSPAVSGLGWHGMGGYAWGGHYECGRNFRAARLGILHRAAVIAHVPPSTVHPAGGYNPAMPPWPGRVLTVGSVGHDVRMWQQRLHDRGWGIDVDGDFGPSSRRYAAAFQAKLHLPVTGTVDKLTWDTAYRAPVTR